MPSRENFAFFAIPLIFIGIFWMQMLRADAGRSPPSLGEAIEYQFRPVDQPEDANLSDPTEVPRSPAQSIQRNQDTRITDQMYVEVLKSKDPDLAPSENGEHKVVPLNELMEKEKKK